MQKEQGFDLNQKIIFLIMIFSIIIVIHSVNSVFAQESSTIEVEVKYTNGDKASFEELKIVAYQDFNKDPIVIQKMTSNPDFITVPKNHKYKIEIYSNDIFGDVQYIQLNNNSEKIEIKIPLSGGIKFEVYYKNGQIPINESTVIIKSMNNVELRRGITNDQGETIRYWIQSTVKENDYYIADVYLGEIFLKSFYPIRIQAGVSVDQKIITDIPKIVEELITINLFDGVNKITSKDGDYSIVLKDNEGNEITNSNVNFRGDAQFSNLKSGTYKVIINTNNKNEEKLWPQTNIHIIGDSNKFSIFKNSENVLKKEKPFHTCNCIAFRLDDIQDYWLADTQVELIKLFSEKNIPLTIGIVGSNIGEDNRIVDIIKENLKKNTIEIANHSWNNEVLTNLDKNTQEKYILDTNQNISKIFDVTPTTFIAPENRYDDGVIEILKTVGFSHFSSHIVEKSYPKIDGESFFITPAVTETAVLDYAIGKWNISENEKIMKDIIKSLDDNGYAVIMMHPQDFSSNEVEENSSPNQKLISNLRSLLDDVSQLDSKLVKITDIKPTTSVNVGNPVTETEVLEESMIDSCNCIAFRLDDVQDYWLNDIQINIMKTFIENKIPLTIGIIANAFGNDQKILEVVKNDINEKHYLEIATRGVGLTSFTNFNKTDQSKNLKESQDNIESILGIRPQVFLPPNNKFNEDTFEILKENNITHISSSLTNGDSPPFEFKNKEFYRFPQITSTGKYNPSINLFERISNESIFAESIQSIRNYGFAVISIHPQEFSTIVNSTYTNSVNQEQINELEELIKKFNDTGYKIVPIGKINSNLIILLPEWIKNNAGWWADGIIDDKTFVQGIEYLVKNGIITY